MKNLEERACFCALNRIFGFEPRVGLGLLEAFGGAEAVFKASPNDISAFLGSQARVRYAPMITGSAFESSAIELERLAASGCRFVCLGEPGYPKALLECDDPPLGLYYKGSTPPVEVFDNRPQIAVIGTRNISFYGRDWCRIIVESFSKARVKPMIVSGLAIGVDVTAHKAALEFGLPTVGVMATGIDDLYPPRNAPVGESMATTPGCALITDYPPGTEAVKINFLRRNRIIAGLCSATILIESRIHGGGMMTARLAYSYDRDVHALPGRIDDPLSQGCNLLIRENIAAPIGNIPDLVERLGLGKADISLKADFKAEVEARYAGLDEGPRRDLLKVAMTVKTHRGIGVDEIRDSLGWTFGKVSRLVNELECDGFISVDLLQHCFPRTVKV